MFRSTGAKVALAALALSGCAGQRGAELARPEPVFDVAAFFSGQTIGDGTLKILFKRAQRLNVEGSGRIEADGTLILDQRVRRGGRVAESREWRIRPDGPGHYTGTLTDASGPVEAEVRGNMLHLRYPMKGGTRAEQWIYLQAGGRLAVNRMNVTKFGLKVATIDEAIRKAD